MKKLFLFTLTAACLWIAQSCGERKSKETSTDIQPNGQGNTDLPGSGVTPTGTSNVNSVSSFSDTTTDTGTIQPQQP